MNRQELEQRIKEELDKNLLSSVPNELNRGLVFTLDKTSQILAELIDAAKRSKQNESSNNS